MYSRNVKIPKIKNMRKNRNKYELREDFNNHQSEIKDYRKQDI
jgi:hypothetical protein